MSGRPGSNYPQWRLENRIGPRDDTPPSKTFVFQIGQAATILMVAQIFLWYQCELLICNNWELISDHRDWTSCCSIYLITARTGSQAIIVIGLLCVWPTLFLHSIVNPPLPPTTNQQLIGFRFLFSISHYTLTHLQECHILKTRVNSQIEGVGNRRQDS